VYMRLKRRKIAISLARSAEGRRRNLIRIESTIYLMLSTSVSN
jgi:hypothetical protein